VIDGESEGGDCDEVISQDDVNQEDSEQDKVDGTKRGAHSSTWYHVQWQNTHIVINSKLRVLQERACVGRLSAHSE